MTIHPFQVVSIQKVCEANKRSLRFLVKAMVDKLLKKVRYDYEGAFCTFEYSTLGQFF